MEFVPNFDPEELHLRCPHHPWFPSLKKCPTNLFRDFQAQMQRSLVTEAYPIPCKVSSESIGVCARWVTSVEFVSEE